MPKRVVVVVAAVVGAVVVGLLAGGGGADRAVVDAGGGSSEFPAAGPGPAAGASAAPEGDGLLAADQAGCVGIGPQSASPTLTLIAEAGANSEIRDVDGGCLVRLRLGPDAALPRQLTWSPSGREVFVEIGAGWTGVDVELRQRAVDAGQVPPAPSAYVAGDRDAVAVIPDGATLEVEEAGDQLLLWAHHEGRSGRLGVGRRSFGAAVVGSPYDPTALAWTFVPVGNEDGCGDGEDGTRVTQATRGGKDLRIGDTDVAGMFPDLWTPSGDLVLHEQSAGCDGGPRVHWLLGPTGPRRLGLAYAVAVRPGAG